MASEALNGSDNAGAVRMGTGEAWKTHRTKTRLSHTRIRPEDCDYDVTFWQAAADWVVFAWTPVNDQSMQTHTFWSVIKTMHYFNYSLRQKKYVEPFWWYFLILNWFYCLDCLWIVYTELMQCILGMHKLKKQYKNDLNWNINWCWQKK